MERMTDMKDLLTHELGDLLYAERRFLTATKQLSREADDPEIKARLDQHVRETETQIGRLEQAFAAIGERAKAEKCEAAIGLREEHDSFKSEEKPTKEILRAFDLGSGLRVEHYEIAAYRSAIAVANVLGQTECAEILRESLREEEDMANFLEKMAPRALKKLLAATQQEN
jgi:ferritin-like metal-binding protein YciE